MNTRPRLTPRPLLWTALATAIMIAVSTMGAPPGGYWAPRGFVERANLMISQDGLRLECGESGDSIVVDLAPGSSDERFFRSSYLRTDVRRFNADPTASRSPFIVDRCVLKGVDPFYHRVDLPYNRVPRWTGTLRFSEADRAASLQGGRDQRLEIMHPLEGVGVTASERVDPSRRNASVRTEFLRIEAPGTREIAADAFFVGGHPVLTDRSDVGSTTVLRLGGVMLPPGRKVRLQTSDWVQLESSGQLFTYVVQGSDRAEIISARTRADGSRRRYLVPHLKPFARSLAQAFEAGLQSTPAARDDGPISHTDIRLTTNRALDIATQDVVSDWCNTLRLGSRPRAVSALVMDAFSGHVLAMPTCPGEVVVDEYRQLSMRMRSRYLQNQNLVRHPVGSALKPFWAAAIATAFPAMLDLELPAHGNDDVPGVLGCPLPIPYRSIGHREWEGLETFIQTSCNRYMVEMATLALMAGAGHDSCEGEDADLSRCIAGAGETEGRPVRFCDRVIRLALTDSLHITGQGCSDLRLVGTTFRPAHALERITGALAYREPAPPNSDAPPIPDIYRAGRYRLDLWRGLIEHLRTHGDTADHTRTALRFASVSPEITNLALNTVEDLRADWVNLLLGGENSRWSNLQLAEAMARLMTGRDVDAQLLAEPGSDHSRGVGEPRGMPAMLDADMLHPGARRRVLHAMELVTGPGGTASRLGPLVRALEAEVREVSGAENYEVRAFAKTGTPAVAVPLAPGLTDRQGSVLILGLLVLPEEAGRRASMRHAEWFSACPVSPGLRDAVLGVPPPGLLQLNGLATPGALAISVAVYVDDLDPLARDASASIVAADLMEPISAHLTQLVTQQVRRMGG